MTSVDPDVLTVPEAARLIGCTPRTLRGALADDDELRAAVVIAFPGRYVRISRPRLLHHLHGEQWRDKRAALDAGPAQLSLDDLAGAAS